MTQVVPEKVRRQARVAFKAGQYEEAVGYYSRLMEARTGAEVLSQRDFQDRVNFGTSLTRCGRHAEAAQEFERVIIEQPLNASAHHKLGLIDMRLGKPQRALEAFRTAARLEPATAAYQWAHAELALALGEREEGEAALDASLAVDPENAEAKAAKSALASNASGAPKTDKPAQASDQQFAGLVEFIKSRPAEDGPPPPPPVDTTYRPLIMTCLGALAFLMLYLYVKVIMIG